MREPDRSTEQDRRADASEPFDLLIRAPRAVIDGDERTAAVGVREETIAAILPIDAAAASDRVIELDGSVVLLPGLVDSHVHVCEPGNTEWEGFASATLAAAYGGITTLVDMPLDSLPTTVNVEALDEKRHAASGQCAVDVGFWGGVVPGNLSELAPLHEAGVLGFKAFLIDSGSPDFPPIDEAQLVAALAALRPLGAPLLIHAEDGEAAAATALPHGRNYAEFLAARPHQIEDRAVETVIAAVRGTGGRAHILHLSSADALPTVEAAQREGLNVTAETCPHYLTLAAEEIPDGATAFKCLPPIRDRSNQDRLWRGLRDGVLSSVVSDHSPSTPQMKELESGDFGSAWGGIASLELTLPVVWTAARRRGHTLADVVAWMADGPARLAGLGRKGRIVVGSDADFCVFAPDEVFVVDSRKLHHRHPVTPYAGRSLRGVVHQTILRGAPVDPGQRRGRLIDGRVTHRSTTAATRA